MLSVRESRSRKATSPRKSPPPAARSSRRRRPPGAPLAPGSLAEEGSNALMAEPVYRRVVIKISGEYLAGSQGAGIDQPTVDRIASDLIAAKTLGAEIAVVVGGGNMVRGVQVSARGVSRTAGDTMGMLATI